MRHVVSDELHDYVCDAISQRRCPGSAHLSRQSDRNVSRRGVRLARATQTRSSHGTTYHVLASTYHVLASLLRRFSSLSRLVSRLCASLFSQLGS